MKLLRAAQPVFVLISLAAILIALTAIARAISARAGFLVEREVVLLVWLAGLLAVAAVFAWVIRRSLRRDDSSLSLWFMILTAILLGSPLALMLLQHPSP